MHCKIMCAAFALAGLFSAGPARAADLLFRPTLEADQPVSPTIFVHVGPAGILLDESAKIKAGGTRIPGASIKISPQVTAAIEAGFFITPQIAVAFTGGFPPNPVIEGSGSIAGYGKLGSIVYGPTALTAQYHLTGFGRFQPYVGVGPTYMLVFNTRDGALSDLRISPAWGVVGQVGADLMVTDRWGVFLDLKKAYLRTAAKGSLGTVPIRADVTLDPLILSGGVTYRF